MTPTGSGSETQDEDEKASQNMLSPTTPSGTSTYASTQKSSSSKVTTEGVSTVALSTPIPSNENLSMSYAERSRQIEEVYRALDEKGTGSLNRFQASKFLKDLMNVNMRNAEIILTGLDSTRSS